MSDQNQEEKPSSDESPLPVPVPNRKRQYWRGIAYGAILLVIFLLSSTLMCSASDLADFRLAAAIVGTGLGLIGYIVLLVFTIANLVKPETRFTGYGLLTMVLATPVVFLLHV